MAALALLRLDDPNKLLEPLSDYIDDDMRVTTMALVNKAWHAESAAVVKWMDTHPELTEAQHVTIYPGLTLPSHVQAAANKMCVLCKGHYDGVFHADLGCYTHADCLDLYLTTNGIEQRTVDEAYGSLPRHVSVRMTYDTPMTVSKVVLSMHNQIVPWHQTVQGFQTSQATARHCRVLRCGVARVRRRFPTVVAEIEALEFGADVPDHAMTREAVLNTLTLVMSLSVFSAMTTKWSQQVEHVTRVVTRDEDDCYMCPRRRKEFMDGLQRGVSRRVWDEFVVHGGKYTRLYVETPRPLLPLPRMVRYMRSRILEANESSMTEDGFLFHSAPEDRTYSTIRRTFPLLTYVNPVLLCMPCIQKAVHKARSRSSLIEILTVEVKWLWQLDKLPQGFPVDTWSALQLLGTVHMKAHPHAACIVVVLRTIIEALRRGEYLVGLDLAIYRVSEILHKAKCSIVPPGFEYRPRKRGEKRKRHN